MVVESKGYWRWPPLHFPGPTISKRYTTLRDATAESIRSLKTHAKFVVVSNADWHIVVRTSMNLNENKRLENFDVVDDEEFCRWHLDLTDGVFADRSAGDWIDHDDLDLSGVADTPPEYTCEVGRASFGRVYEKGTASVGPLR